jgi:hypothetical protein
MMIKGTTMTRIDKWELKLLVRVHRFVGKRMWKLMHKLPDELLEK